MILIVIQNGLVNAIKENSWRSMLLNNVSNGRLRGSGGGTGGFIG